MLHSDFDAHRALSGQTTTDIQVAVQQAQEKSADGRFLVCITNAGDVLVLPYFSASVRDDIEVLFDTDKGYSVPGQQGEVAWN